MSSSSGQPNEQDAMADAMRAALAGSAPQPDGVTAAAAHEQARRMLAGMSAEEVAGLRDMQNLTLSIGLPATRAIFHGMIAASGKSGAEADAARKEVADFSPVTEEGCMKVDFFDSVAQRPAVAYLLLEQCSEEHDLGAQLAKIKPLVPAEKWPEILRHLSILIGIGRNVYATVARQRLPLIRGLFGLAADDPCSQFAALKVDPANTTLFLDASWPGRVGIFVHLAPEAAKQPATSRGNEEVRA